MSYRAWTNGLPTPPSEVTKMIILAEEGLSRRDIAACTGWSYRTVRKHVGHLVCGAGAPTVDIERYRRMLKAASSSSYGEREGIAKRFGLKSTKVLDVTLTRARRRVSEADATSLQKE